jgi:hypothetical protein
MQARRHFCDILAKSLDHGNGVARDGIIGRPDSYSGGRNCGGDKKSSDRWRPTREQSAKVLSSLPQKGVYVRRPVLRTVAPWSGVVRTRAFGSHGSASCQTLVCPGHPGWIVSVSKTTIPKMKRCAIREIQPVISYRAADGFLDANVIFNRTGCSTPAFLRFRRPQQRFRSAGLVVVFGRRTPEALAMPASLRLGCQLLCRQWPETSFWAYRPALHGVQTRLCSGLLQFKRIKASFGQIPVRVVGSRHRRPACFHEDVPALIGRRFTNLL